MSVFKFSAVAAAGLTLAACAGSPDGMGPGPRENTGTLLGAGTGALLGAAVAGGGTGNRLAGAAVGGLLGGLIGNRMGAALDDEDRQRAYDAQLAALDRGQSGAPVSWRNPDSGPLRHGRAGARLSGSGPQLPLLHTYYLCRWHAADRARHRLPPPGRQLAANRLGLPAAGRALILLIAAIIGRDVSPVPRAALAARQSG